MSLFTPRNTEFKNYLDKVKFLLIWRLALVFTFVLITLTIVFSFDDSNALYTYFAADIVIILGLLYLYKTRNYSPIFFFYAISGSVIIHLDLNFVLDSPHYTNFLWMIVIVLIAFFGLGMKWGTAVLSLNIFGSLYFIFFSMRNHYETMHEIESMNEIAISIEVPSAMIVIGYLIYLFIKAQRTAEYDLLQANKELEANNALIHKRDSEKTILVKEIHHRVKNNLQIIISLLRLQMAELKSAESKKQFSEAINRVMVMSSIHQKLYQQKDITQFKLSSFIEDLSSELKLFFKEEFPIEINITSEYEGIDLKTVVPVGLILNELLSNSFKYAFDGMDKGEINIRVKEERANFTLYYSDNGKWREPANENSGFGVELIEILTEQLNGVKEFNLTDNGTEYTFTLKKMKD
jgi:two-component sensor histidine kinase